MNTEQEKVQSKQRALIKGLEMLNPEDRVQLLSFLLGQVQSMRLDLKLDPPPNEEDR